MLYVVRLVISSVIPDLHALGGIFENLGKRLVRFFLDHGGNLAIGFLQDLRRLALPDLLIVLVEELLGTVQHSVLIPLIQNQGAAELGVGQGGNEPAVLIDAVGIAHDIFRQFHR